MFTSIFLPTLYPLFFLFSVSYLPSLCFPLLSASLPSLSLQRLHALGGELAESAQKCTHLVASKVTRTVKFLTAMSMVKHIVTPAWLDDSWKDQKFVGSFSSSDEADTFCFILWVSKLGMNCIV